MTCLLDYGPKISIKILPMGEIYSNFKTEFVSKGINQTVYRIYLQTTCNISISSMISYEETAVSTDIIIAEIVIVGGVPQTYYNLQGMKEIGVDDSLELIQD